MGFAADCGLCLELATQGRFLHVPEPLLQFRLHEKSLSVDRSDPIHQGQLGRRLDAAALEWARGLELSPVERDLFDRQLAVWCRKAEKPRRGLWRLAGYRSLYVRAAHRAIDARRRRSAL